MSSPASSSATVPAAAPPRTFPQFVRLPPELQLMVWDIACAPPKGIYFAIISAGLFPGAPGVSAACFTSRREHVRQRDATLGFPLVQDRQLNPYPGQGGQQNVSCRFDPDRDVLFWSPLMFDLRFPVPRPQHWLHMWSHLTSVTIGDSRHQNHIGTSTPWNGILRVLPQDNGTILYEGKYDALGVTHWFRNILHGRMPALKTINIHRHARSEVALLQSSLEEFAVGVGSDAVKSVFGDDAVHLVDLADDRHVRRVLSALGGEAPARLAMLGLRETHRLLARGIYRDELVEHLEFLWLHTVYLWKKDRGVRPRRKVGCFYYWAEEHGVFICDEKSWDRDDPDILEILEDMPEIRLVYTLVQSRPSAA
ncbi:hypothetical protein Hte_011627 [Hypoxylon texense]